MTLSPPEQNNTIFHEMMTHPALFTHPHPMKVIIIGDEDQSILNEVLKHEHVAEITRIQPMSNYSSDNSKVSTRELNEWLTNTPPNSIDIIINASQSNTELLQEFFTKLNKDGMLIQQSASPFDITSIKSLSDQLRQIGYHDQRILNFPQPSFSSGWRSILMATKLSHFKRISEKAVYAKTFKTYYYNLDTHRASLVLPEFMREEWAI